MKPLDFGKGAKPLYIQIRDILKDKILSYEYAPGQTIPSEAQIQEMFGVSRITARQAIAKLESEGLVERSRGKGTRVLFQNKITEELAGVTSFTEEMVERGIQPGTKYVHIEIVEADIELSEIFQCKKSDELYRISRVRTGNGVPVTYAISYFPKSLNLPLDDEVYRGSIYSMFDKLQISKPSYSEESFGAFCANKDTAEKLDMKKGEAILVRKRTAYDEVGNVLEYTLAIYPGDRYLYSIQLNN